MCQANTRVIVRLAIMRSEKDHAIPLQNSDPAYKDKGDFPFTGEIEKVAFAVKPAEGRAVEPKQ